MVKQIVITSNFWVFRPNCRPRPNKKHQKLKVESEILLTLAVSMNHRFQFFYTGKIHCPIERVLETEGKNKIVSFGSLSSLPKSPWYKILLTSKRMVWCTITTATTTSSTRLLSSWPASASITPVTTSSRISSIRLAPTGQDGSMVGNHGSKNQRNSADFSKM